MRGGQPQLAAPLCIHDYTGAPASAAFLFAPRWCSYCEAVLWGSTADLWECSACGALCHKRCVPTGERLAACCPQRADRAERQPCGRVYRMPAPRGAAGELDAERQPAGYDAAEEAAEGCIDFAFPGDPLRETAVGSSRPCRGGCEGPARVSVSSIAVLLRELVQEWDLTELRWSLTDLAALAEVHHRRYLRRLGRGRPVRDTALQERLIVGVTHALACYGSSHRPELDAMRFDEAVYHAAVLRGLGWAARPEGELLHWCWLPTEYCPAWHIAVDKRLGAAVLAVRGTLHATDLYIDVNGQPAAFCGGKAHSGIAAAACELYQEVGPLLRSLFLPDTEGPTAGGTGGGRPYAAWPLLVVGHSLGGSIAALLCLLLRRDGLAGPLRAQGLCFGPVPCLCESLANEVDGLCTSVVLGKDCGARLSLAALDQLVRELCMPQGLWGRHEVLAAVAAAAAVAASAAPPPPEPPAAAAAEGEPSPRPEPARPPPLPPARAAPLFPPGEVLMLHVCRGGDAEEAAALPEHDLVPGHPVLLRVSADGACGGLVVGGGMITDHRPESYAWAVDALGAAQSAAHLRALHRAGAGAVGTRLCPADAIPEKDLAFSAFC